VTETNWNVQAYVEENIKLDFKELWFWKFSLDKPEMR
jgi:hypothetical protein